MTVHNLLDSNSSSESDIYVSTDAYCTAAGIIISNCLTVQIRFSVDVGCPSCSMPYPVSSLHEDITKVLLVMQLLLTDNSEIYLFSGAETIF